MVPPKELAKTKQKKDYYLKIKDWEQKGIETDFIRIYTFGTNKNKIKTIGFLFNETQNSTKTKIQINMKSNDTLSYGISYDYIEFKNRLKTFINSIEKLKEKNNFNSIEIESKIKDIFEFEKQLKLDKKNKINKQEKSINL